MIDDEEEVLSKEGRGNEDSLVRKFAVDVGEKFCGRGRER